MTSYIAERFLFSVLFTLNLIKSLKNAAAYLGKEDHMTVVDLLGGTYDAGGINKALVGLIGYGVTAADMVHCGGKVKGMGVSRRIATHTSYAVCGTGICKALADGKNIFDRLLICKITNKHTVNRVSAAVKKN